jgi:hypothetical protein
MLIVAECARVAVASRFRSRSDFIVSGRDLSEIACQSNSILHLLLDSHNDVSGDVHGYGF